jgi:hypothetical protein
MNRIMCNVYAPLAALVYSSSILVSRSQTKYSVVFFEGGRTPYTSILGRKKVHMRMNDVKSVVSNLNTKLFGI